MDSVPARLTSVREAVTTAARAAGRDSAEITLIGVTKRKPVTAIESAFAAGLHDIGENHADEFLEKATAFAPDGLRYHFIGRLSSRLARKIAGQATLIHTLDSLRLAQKLSLIATEEGREIHALVQVNQGDEATKGGIAPEEVPKLVREAVALQGLRITGLMSIPPFDNRPRDWFCQLRQLRDTVAEATGVALPQLSMGMSHDFAEAIAEGATLVRVGTAIFGARD
ncbi:MAG: YggS family pyridoxal phosphate-dependent enzyme [Candidatus Thermoplasmatota archaeon]|nr:YggS family pyridoxal phosphate-dependent enzyme [Candidatus Thermoplasmatota archaeon]